MSVRSFHSVFMASAVAGAALGCYLVSLRVASERAALEDVEASIVQTQTDIRLLQTEVGTRSRLTQLERWNASALDLSAPAATQILGDKFQLATLVRPEHKAVEAPVVLASAPAPQPSQPLAQQDNEPDSAVAPAPELLHTASLKIEQRTTPSPKPSASVTIKAEQSKIQPAKAVADADKAAKKKSGEKVAAAETKPVTRPVRTAKVDPLAPLPAGKSTAKGTRSDR
ncbi:MAG: hypothetical protein ACTHN4_11220 [Sphingomicrobium sp.]